MHASRCFSGSKILSSSKKKKSQPRYRWDMSRFVVLCNVSLVPKLALLRRREYDINWYIIYECIVSVNVTFSFVA